MDYELHLAGLEIEITRDCNLNCPHCMRYEPNEPMDAYRVDYAKLCINRPMQRK